MPWLYFSFIFIYFYAARRICTRTVECVIQEDLKTAQTVFMFVGCVIQEDLKTAQTVFMFVRLGPDGDHSISFTCTEMTRKGGRRQTGEHCFTLCITTLGKLLRDGVERIWAFPGA